MTHRYAELMFTPEVQAAQEHYGTRVENQRYEAQGGPNVELSHREMAFIAARDSFYLASNSPSGWPYLQHRGGPPGFLKIRDSKTLIYADFRGNNQYISVGNLSADDRVSLFLMDYPNRLRLKILGRLKFQDIADADPGLVEALRPYPYRASMERVVFIQIEAFDWNCNQHITPRFTQAQVNSTIESLKQRIAELEAELGK